MTTFRKRARRRGGYSVVAIEDLTGDIEALPMRADQSTEIVRNVEPAASIMEQIENEAIEIIHNLGLLAR